MKKLKSDESPHIPELPQHEPFFYPIGFWFYLGWVSIPIFYPV